MFLFYADARDAGDHIRKLINGNHPVLAQIQRFEKW
jgi:hypothetical protein